MQEVRDLLEARLVELAGETKRVENALRELGAPMESPVRRGRPPGKKGPGRPRGSKNGKRAGGTRADHAVKLITERPGITASDIARELKMKPNYLYRVLATLEKERRIRKDGRQYFPPAASVSDAD